MSIAPTTFADRLDTLPTHGQALPGEAHDQAYRWALEGMRFDAMTHALFDDYPGPLYGYASYANAASVAIGKVRRFDERRAAERHDGERRIDGREMRIRAEYRATHPAPSQQPARASPVPISAAPSVSILAFTEAHYATCAYCLRVGTHPADPDGASWHRDLVTTRQAGTSGMAGQKVLACSTCRQREDRVLPGDE